MKPQNRFGWKSPAGIDAWSTSDSAPNRCLLDSCLPDGRSTAAVVEEP
jgi:hypothetical protein